MHLMFFKFHDFQKIGFTNMGQSSSNLKKIQIKKTMILEKLIDLEKNHKFQKIVHRFFKKITIY